MEIKNLFTEQDFKILLDALEHLPHKNLAGSFMMDVFDTILPGGPGKDEIKRQREIREKKDKAEREAITEDVRLVQGKIIQLKRWLIEQDALNQVNKIINK